MLIKAQSLSEGHLEGQINSSDGCCCRAVSLIEAMRLKGLAINQGNSDTSEMCRYETDWVPAKSACRQEEQTWYLGFLVLEILLESTGLLFATKSFSSGIVGKLRMEKLASC